MKAGLDQALIEAAPPDFVIVGAPKCGTTALFTYLSTHPQIEMSARKEPFYWCPDIKRSGQIIEREEYDALWKSAPGSKLRGEASAEYLRSEVAIAALQAANPLVRLIAMIRNPVEIVSSLHANLVLGMQEELVDFERAWRLQDQRARGESVPTLCKEPVLLQYAAYGSIGDQLERFMELVPADRRHVIVYDDFGSSTLTEYRKVLDFLGLPDDGRSDFTPVHVNRASRSARLAKLLRERPRWLSPLRALSKDLGISPGAWLERFNTHPVQRRPLRPEFEAELIATFEPQVQKVERLLGRDLSQWKTPLLA